MNKTVLLRANGLLPPAKGNYRQGIGRANYELVRAIVEKELSGIDFSFYCNQIGRPFYRFSEWPIKKYWNILPYRLNDFCGIEASWRKLFTKYDLFHITDNYAQVYDGERFVVTIHDMKLFEEKPRSRKLFEKMSNDSLGIATCSNYTKSEIVRVLGASPDKITVIPWGINHNLFYPRSKKIVDTLKEKMNIKGEYFFSCSCANPRKNARDILKAFRLFREESKDIALVMAWGNVPNDILDEYMPEIKEGAVVFLNYVDDNDLAIFYSGALASLLVSSLEGFGFPVLESMACGTNCITSKNSSLTEIGGNYAYFVKEHDIDDIAAAMFYFCDNGKGDTDKLISYAKTYSWANTASAYIDFYKQFL